MVVFVTLVFKSTGHWNQRSFITASIFLPDTACHADDICRRLVSISGDGPNPGGGRSQRRNCQVRASEVILVRLIHF